MIVWYLQTHTNTHTARIKLIASLKRAQIACHTVEVEIMQVVESLNDTLGTAEILY